MDLNNYLAFTEQLTVTLAADERVVGLVLLGSTANGDRQPDAWSDHDFFVVTQPGIQETFRTTTDWLPDSDEVVLTVRETAHGLKALYANGHLLEFAVFDVDELRIARAGDYDIAFDRGKIAEIMREIALPDASMRAYDADTMRRDMGMIVSLFVVGAGRVARGEVLSGRVFIQTHAMGHLLPLLAHVLDSDDKHKLDGLDAYRRFEQVFPEVGAEINAALSRDPIGAALGLLDIYERVLRDVDGYPVHAVQTARAYLRGIQSPPYRQI